MIEQKNVFGDAIKECSCKPMTGFFREGNCVTDERDTGSHAVCVQVNEEFLHYSMKKSNDLSTPMPDFDFPGLVAGNRWYLCAQRWKQAYEDGVAPKVLLESTNQEALKIIPLEILKKYALDLF